MTADIQREKCLFNENSFFKYVSHLMCFLSVQTPDKPNSNILKNDFLHLQKVNIQCLEYKKIKFAHNPNIFGDLKLMNLISPNYLYRIAPMWNLNLYIQYISLLTRDLNLASTDLNIGCQRSVSTDLNIDCQRSASTDLNMD